MATPQSPIGSRRRLGAELKRLRSRTGMTLDEVAELMTCSTSKISRLETGKGVPKVPDVSELMRIYGVTSDTEREMLLRLVRDGRQPGWWEPLTEGVSPERYVLDAPGRYAALESDATAVRTFDVSIVPGLLQTPEYARAVFSETLPHHLPAEIDRLIGLRMKRQEALSRKDPPPLELVALLDEAMLARVVGGAAVMAAQLDRLLELGSLPNVTIRVLGFEAGILRAHVGDFALIEIPVELGSDVVYIEGHAGDSYLDARSDVRLYQDVFTDALHRSLSGDASRSLIGRYRADHVLPGPGRPPR